jgi:two-component system chemotaxis sensor kinase CheA
VLEKMKDPLIHIIRNAVDHGIEDIKDRVSAGKPEFATLQLIAENQAGGVRISVVEDGAGIDLDKVRAKAIEKGIIKEEDDLTSEEINQLILRPGFSTAAVLSDISGRGVGLDVVSSTVAELGGTLEVLSQQGSGTTFEIELPSNVSVMDSLIVDIEGLMYAVPVANLHEIINITTTRVHATKSEGEGFMLRKEFVPLARLSDYLKTENKSFDISQFENRNSANDNSEQTPRKLALITQVKKRVLAFEVNQVFGIQSTVVRAISEYINGSESLAGVTILGDGSPVMILNLDYISKKCFEI